MNALNDLKVLIRITYSDYLKYRRRGATNSTAKNKKLLNDYYNFYKKQGGTMKLKDIVSGVK